MKIQSINNNYYAMRNCNKPSFKSFKREVLKPGASLLADEVLWRNNTNFFRSDMAWRELISYIKEKYADVDKVQVFNYACSNGLETYTFLMELFSTSTQNDVNKFTPIVAKDFDPFAINLANRKIVDIEKFELIRINQHTNGHFEDFFKKNSKIEGKYSPKENLSNLVEFSVGDFTKEYSDIPKDNVIIIIRNCWPYFSKEDIEKLPQKLYNHLGKNVTLVTGNFDYIHLGYNIFKDCGFKQTRIPFVYEK